MKVYFRKCNKCKNLVITKDEKDIICCDEVMSLINPNEVEAAIEKHMPEYTIVNNVLGEKINIKVNHVMEDNHYIMWILMVSESRVFYKEFKPGETPEVTFDYDGPSKIYSYCNLHSLWMKEVK